MHASGTFLRTVPAIAAMAFALSPTIARADRLEDLCEEFTGFDQDGDGQAELAEAEVLHTAGAGERRVVMLVEKRLLSPLEGAPDLAAAVRQWAEDLAAEGFRAEVAAVELAPAEGHQDGRYLLALREFLRALHRAAPLEGAVLTGRFPDAYLVRTINWRKSGDLTLHKGKAEQQTYKKVRYLRRQPETIAQRADIVLADLDGRWEDLYVGPKTAVPSVLAVFDGAVPTEGGECVDLQVGAATHEDFFHIADGDAEVDAAARSVRIDNSVGDRECAESDRSRPNHLARPDILVSRLDARGVALRPRADIVGTDGAGLLDADGRPRAVKFASRDEVPSWSRVWEPDPLLERRLLAEYFERNHRYRTGAEEIAWRPSSIACDLRSGYRVMRAAAADWESGEPALADIHGRPTLTSFAEWIAYPAVLRTVRAHSFPYGSQFRRAGTASLDAALGGPAWSWTASGDELRPSLAAACGRGMLNWYLMRSLWENGKVAPGPAFYHHTGCEAISPPGAKSLPYHHPSYGRMQGAESLLLFGNGLALVGRAKVYYDEPRGFAQALAGGETFGAAWAAYYEAESRREITRPLGGDIDRKRAYFWSVLGDWTLRLRRG